MIRTLLVLATASLCAGCARARTPPHGAGVARETLARKGFAWRTVEAEGIHLHYLAGGYAADHASEFARAAAAALRYDLMLGHLPRPSEPVELFLVNSREQARWLTERGPLGQAIPGELTAFFVVLPGRLPAFRHEIMHALTLKQWGTHRMGSWLQEGVATWAGGGLPGPLRRRRRRRLPARRHPSDVGPARPALLGDRRAARVLHRGERGRLRPPHGRGPCRPVALGVGSTGEPSPAGDRRRGDGGGVAAPPGDGPAGAYRSRAAAAARMPDAVTPPSADGSVLLIPHFTRSIVGRALLAWAFVRVAATAAMGGAAAAVGLPPGNPLRLNPVAALFVVAVVGATGWVSARRRNEDLFLLSLGCGRARQLATTVAPAALLEAVIAVMVAAP